MLPLMTATLDLGLVEQPVQDVRRFMGGRRDDVRVIRPELIRKVGVELHVK